MLLVGALLPAGANADAGTGGGVAGPIEVAMDRTAATGILGDHLTVRSTITNTGAAPTGPLIAHLDVVSLRNDVYVDPEDWSATRTVDVESLAPGARTALSWTVHNVNDGEFDLYVVLLPRGATAGPLVVSPPVRLAVAGRQTVNPGNSLGVVVTVPAVLGLLAAGTRLRRRGLGLPGLGRRGRGSR